jgi:hypothetical protein
LADVPCGKGPSLEHRAENACSRAAGGDGNRFSAKRDDNQYLEQAARFANSGSMFQGIVSKMPASAMAMMEISSGDNDATTRTLSMHCDFEFARHA